MKVYLVQHGEAKSEEEDPQRKLTDKGIGEVQKVADFLRPLKLTVNAIWHSGKPRAQQTGELLAKAIGALDRTVQRALLVTSNEEAEIVEFQFGSVVCIEQRKDGKWKVAWMIRPPLLHG